MNELNPLPKNSFMIRYKISQVFHTDSTMCMASDDRNLLL